MLNNPLLRPLVSVLWVAGGCVFLANAANAQEKSAAVIAPTPFDVASVNGTWHPVRGTLAGRELPKTQLDSIELTIDSGEYRTRGTGFEESGRMVFQQPLAGKPQPVDVVISGGDNAGKTFKGIIRIDHGELVVCYAISGVRPDSFESNEESQTLLLEYEKRSPLSITVTPSIIGQEEEETPSLPGGSRGDSGK
jgi:uncharacterized protein (TIGR03067 family)